MANRPQQTKNPYPGFREGVEEAHRYMSYVKKQLKPYEDEQDVSNLFDEMEKAYEARKYRKRIYDTAEELTPEITKEYLYSIYVIFKLINQGQILLVELNGRDDD